HHKFNEHKQVDQVIARLKTGEKAALISDAGTPGISDPGFLMVRSCIENGLEVECLPGATSIIPALVVSGLPCDKFVFEGFLPHKKGRKTRLEFLAEDPRTIVFLESPHRLNKTLKQLSEYFGADRYAVICRELSKMYEEKIRGTVAELAEQFAEKKWKGEIVLVVEGKNSKK
ncbi:MAG: ribosomal RNA small subunit methyltransferase I, partial [Chitinophagales bacterium]